MPPALLDLVPRGLTAEVACGDDVHVLGWDPTSGLRSLGHEPTDEDVLGAFEGRRPACVQLARTWDDYKLEPLLIAALLGGRVGLLRRQTVPTVGPPVADRRAGLFGLLEPFLGFPDGLRRALAAEAVLAYGRTDLLRRGRPDDTSELAATVRQLLATASEEAFGRPVDTHLVRITPADVPTALFVRGLGEPLAFAGQLSVSWAALAVLGLAAGTPRGALVVDVEAGDEPGRMRGAGFTFERRDRDLTPVSVGWATEDLQRRVGVELAVLPR